jgi:hypothetical protein
MNNDEVVAYIRECLENGNFDFDTEHLDYHAFAEGFDLDDTLRVVIENAPLAELSDRSRWFFSGMIPSLRDDARFRGRYLHVIVHYEEGARVELATAYRPLVTEWITGTRRR